MFDHGNAKLQSQAAEISQSKVISSNQKRKRIDTLRNSMLGGTDSSFKVVTSIANTMIGSAIIVYPILFIKDGLLGSLIIMLCIGCFQFLTCRILIIHNRKSQSDFGISIRRICGQRTQNVNSAVNALLLFVVCFAYFLLVVQNFFQVSAAIISVINDWTPPKTNTINFKEYSIQWATLICAVFCAPLLFWKSIDGLLKLFKYTIYFVIAYGLFILTSLLRQIAQGTIHFEKYKYFDPQFSNVAGAFALSFLIHPTAAPIIKKNKIQQNNQRDLLLGYCLTAFIYFFVGFVGGLTCATQVDNILANPDQYSTIFDCVNARNNTQQTIFFVLGKLVQFGILLQNVSVFPILNFLARAQFIKLINSKKHEKLLFNLFTGAQIILGSLISIFCIDVSIVLSFDGAIIGFFMAYGIPIFMHLTCYHKKLKPQQKRMRASLLTSTQSEIAKSAIKDNQGLDPDAQINFDQNDPEEIQSIVRCNPHPKKDKVKHFILYGGLTVVGIALGVFKLLSFFQ